MDIQVTPAPAAGGATLPAPAAVRRAPDTRQRMHRLFVALTVLLIGVVVAGFWRTYFGRLAAGTFQAHWLVHVHGAVFTGWMVLMLAQVLLVSSGRTRLHRRLGAAGGGYAALVVAAGLAMSMFAPVMHVRAGEWTIDQAAGFMLLPLGDMVLFTGFVAAGVFYRRRPQVHKRLMVAATVSIAFAAAARLFDTSIAALYLVWLSPIAAAIAYEMAVERRVHPAWIVSFVVLAAAGLRITLIQWEGWLRVGRAVLRPLL